MNPTSGLGSERIVELPQGPVRIYQRGEGRPIAIRRDADKILRSVSRRYTLDAARRFQAFPQPVLIAWAEDDRFFPVAHAERLAVDFPNARLVVVPASRTYIPEDQPERLAILIAELTGGHDHG